MTGSDFNPLAYFKELHLFPRVTFSIGLVLFVTGAFKDWRIAGAGVGIMFLAVSYNFFANSLWHDPGPPYGGHVAWAPVFQGVLSLVIAGAVLYVVFYIYRHGEPPAILRALPQGAPTLK